MNRGSALLGGLLLAACAPVEALVGPIADSAPGVTTGTVETPEPRNILFVLMDDVGNDKIGTFGEHPTAPPTPTLDRLAEEGVLFRNAYAYPICTPTRAALLTGRRAIRTGIGENFQGPQTGELSLNELLIPEMLSTAPVPYDTAVVGKWHLAHPSQPDVRTHMTRSGFGSFQGTLSNVLDVFDQASLPTDYNHWEYLDNGEVTAVDAYLTSFMIDRAIEQTQSLHEPWFLYLPIQAAHHPWTPPPADLLVQPLGDPPTDIESFAAIIEVLDAELGRMLASMDPEVLARTTVVVMGDNGTPGALIEPPLIAGQGKLTLYEGGVNVPLIVWSPLIAEPGREIEDLVEVQDWFPTLAEIAGVPTEGLTRADGSPATLDGLSLLPLLQDPSASLGREAVMCERFGPVGGGPYANEQRAVIEQDWKYAQLDLDSGEFRTLHDLRGRSDDGPNLLDAPLSAEADAALIRLKARMEAFEAIVYEGP